MPPTGACEVPPLRLPGGSEAVLCALRGSDEEWAGSLPSDLSEPEFVTALLARAVRFLDGVRGSAELIRQLTPGDRDFLLLQVARLTFGKSAELLLTCPLVACKARMHATFDIERLTVESRPVKASYPLSLPDGREVLFRLPVGADQEAAVGWGELPREEKRERLLARCVLGDGGVTGAGVSEILSEAIHARMPQVDLDFSAICPECGHESSHRLEPARWLISELRKRFSQFEREVHLLSLHYHWPLTELLLMPRRERVRWVNLLAREVGRATAGGVTHL